MAYNFQVSNPPSGSYEGKYDYASIMHYSEDAFAKNGTKTIIPLQNFEGIQLGYALTLSNVRAHNSLIGL